MAPAERNVVVRRNNLLAHCAPLERQTVVGREGYKYLAPLEPEPQFYLGYSGSTFPALTSDRSDVFVKVFFSVVVA